MNALALNGLLRAVTRFQALRGDFKRPWSERRKGRQK